MSIYSRLDKKPLVIRTTQKRAFSNSLLDGSGRLRSSRTFVRVVDNWHPLPVFPTTQRSDDVLKGYRRGARAFIACPAFTRAIACVLLAMCSRYTEHNTIMLESFLPANAPSSCKLLLEPYGVSGLPPLRARWKRNRTLLPLATRACRRADAIRAIDATTVSTKQSPFSACSSFNIFFHSILFSETL